MNLIKSNWAYIFAIIGIFIARSLNVQDQIILSAAAILMLINQKESR